MRFIKNIFQKNEIRSDENKADDQYFVNAKSWADDIYTESVASCNRYRFALLWAAVLLTGLITIIIILLPLRQSDLIVVHQSDDGTVWVSPSHQSAAPSNKAQIESDVVRYIENRESYSASSYHVQYSLVNLLSSPTVAEEYMQSQSIDNKKSVVNRLGKRKIRTVHIENIVFLDRMHQSHKHHHKKRHANLAQVNFTLTDHDHWSGRSKKKHYVALISWTYRGTPKDPESKWRDWNGFTVTRYTVEQSNI